MTMSECKWCGMIHGPRCPSVKAIEYFPDGTIKRVEFMTPADRSPSIQYYNPWPWQVPQTPSYTTGATGGNGKHFYPYGGGGGAAGG
jgi:hypothetical protein